MPRKATDRKAHKRYIKEWMLFLMRNETLKKISALREGDFTESTPALGSLYGSAMRIWKENPGPGIDVEQLGLHLNQARADSTCSGELLLAIEHFFRCKKAAAPRHPSHAKKHEIAEELGLLSKPYFLRDVLAGRLADGAAPQFTLRQKLRDRKPGVKSGRVLSEVVDGDAFVANQETGFDVIGPDESVVYYAEGENDEIIIELVVLRNVAGDARFSATLMEWIYEVIMAACEARTDVRPHHPGKIVQLGLNMGARSARAIGLASSFKSKKIDKSIKIDRDKDAVGVISLAWGLMEKLMPKEVIDITEMQCSKLGLPRLETRDLPSDTGYTVKIGEEEVTFSTSRRAPPEGYLSNGYEALTHIDKVYSPYAFTFNVDRRDNPEKVPKEAAEPVHGTRGASQRRAHPKPVVRGPPGGGASFVDLTLGVVVRQTPGTMMAIRPQYMHGTTKGYGAENSGVTISFSERIVAAWEIARDGNITVKSFQTRDDGN